MTEPSGPRSPAASPEEPPPPQATSAAATTADGIPRRGGAKVMCGFPPLLSAECSPRYCGPTTMASLIGVQRTAPGQQRRRTDLLPLSPPLAWDELMHQPAYQHALERLP